MERIPFINFGYVESYKPTYCYNIKNFMQSIRQNGCTAADAARSVQLRAANPGNPLFERDPWEENVIVYHDGHCYRINEDLRAIAPDGVITGDKARQQELRAFLMGTFPNFPVD